MASGAGRAGKIERLRKALSEGSYQVSNEDLAAKLLDHLLER